MQLFALNQRRQFGANKSSLMELNSSVDNSESRTAINKMMDLDVPGAMVVHFHDASIAHVAMVRALGAEPFAPIAFAGAG